MASFGTEYDGAVSDNRGPYPVRFATEADSARLVEIHNRNARVACENFERGFLLAPTSQDGVLAALDRGTRYWVAVDGSDRILGFVMIARPIIVPEVQTTITWADPRFQAQVQQENHRYIQILAVHPEAMGQGVARTLYGTLPMQFPDTVFSAMVVWQPIQNQRSLQFHQRQGFTEWGRLSADQFLDLHNYEAIILGKVIPPA